MIRRADVSRGFFPEKVMKTVIRGEFTDEQLDAIIAVLQSPELSKDQMEWGVSRIPSVSPEAASILVRTWFDGGKNKMKWEEKQLKTWIQGQLITKVGASMKKVASELLKIAKELVAAGEKKDISRAELSRLLGGRRFRLRKVSFRGLGYGEAIALSVEGLPSGGGIPAAVYEANKEVYQALVELKKNYTFDGLPIVGA